LIDGSPIDFGKNSCTQKPEQCHFGYKLRWGLALLCPTLDQLPTAFERTKLAKLTFLKRCVWH